MYYVTLLLDGKPIVKKTVKVTRKAKPDVLHNKRPARNAACGPFLCADAPRHRHRH